MSNNVNTKQVLLIGAGPMAIDYGKVLNGLQVEYTVVGRGAESAAKFTDACNHQVVEGGLEQWIENNKDDSPPAYAIVALPLQALAGACIALSTYGVENILVEKPGGLTIEEIDQVAKIATTNNSRIYVAYNRRFLSSVHKAQEIINEDGGIKSFTFEFTEWGHVIGKLDKPKEVLENWFLANSTHIVDLAFFLGGQPDELHCVTTGTLDWHSAAASFAGCGRTAEDASFSYHANWDAPGRWVVEMMTAQHRLIFKPVEKLQIQKKGSVAVEFVEVDDHIDTLYKPGLFLQTKAFLENQIDQLSTIQEQASTAKNVFAKMVNRNG